jgi:hypothetical protein
MCGRLYFQWIFTVTFSAQLHRLHSKVRTSGPSDVEITPVSIIGPWHLGHGGRSISMRRSAMRDCGMFCAPMIRREHDALSHRWQPGYGAVMLDQSAKCFPVPDKRRSTERTYQGRYQPLALGLGRRSRYQDIDGTFCKPLSHHSVTFGNGSESGVLLRAES